MPELVSQETQDAAYWEKEAKAAFKARDDAKDKARRLESQAALADADREELARLKGEHESAEEERRKKAGEFDTLKQSLTQKHETALKAEREQIAQLHQRVADLQIDHAFAAATDLFGGAVTSKTVLTHDIARAYFAPYVKLESVDVDGRKIDRLVIRTPTGEILPQDGSPAGFVKAMSDLIDLLPNKDHVLRGSGKAGSGSSGGSTSVTLDDGDLVALTARAKSGDLAAIGALQKRQRARGGLIMGEAWERPIKSA